MAAVGAGAFVVLVMAGVGVAGVATTGVCGAAANVFDGAMFRRGGRDKIGADVVGAPSGAGVVSGVLFCVGDGAGWGVKFILRLRGRINKYNPNRPINTDATNEK